MFIKYIFFICSLLIKFICQHAKLISIQFEKYILFLKNVWNSFSDIIQSTQIELIKAFVIFKVSDICLFIYIIWSTNA